MYLKEKSDKMKKEKINVEELNSAIKTGSRVLNLFYFMLIVLLIGGVTFLLKTWKLMRWLR